MSAPVIPVVSESKGNDQEKLGLRQGQTIHPSPHQKLRLLQPLGHQLSCADGPPIYEERRRQHVRHGASGMLFPSA
jgi:hypothetical protein